MKGVGVLESCNNRKVKIKHLKRAFRQQSREKRRQPPPFLLNCLLDLFAEARFIQLCEGWTNWKEVFLSGVGRWG